MTTPHPDDVISGHSRHFGRTPNYVVGFYFSPTFTEVALIQKNRPDWQRGRLNGIGGHIEDNETPDAAMRREFLEETGEDVKTFEHYVRLEFVNSDGEEGDVYFFRAFGDPRLCMSRTDEEVIVVPTPLVPSYNIIANLRWLIPLAQQALTEPVIVKESMHREMPTKALRP